VTTSKPLRAVLKTALGQVQQLRLQLGALEATINEAMSQTKVVEGQARE